MTCRFYTLKVKGSTYRNDNKYVYLRALKMANEVSTTIYSKSKNLIIIVLYWSIYKALPTAWAFQKRSQCI